MVGATKQNKVDELISAVETAVRKGDLFATERLAENALGAARQAQDFAAMSRLVDLLRNARAERLRLALETGRITIVDQPFDESIKIKTGCYLVQPPLVGSDGRRLRMLALNAQVHAAVLCREPLTRTRLVPVVAISPGSTLRTKVPPPNDAANPELDWFADAMLELGDTAIASLDPTLPVTRRIEVLFDDLDALPEHPGLHQALIDAFAEARKANAA